MSALSAVQNPPAGIRYTDSPLAYNRFRTRVVRVGDVPIGGSHPIVLQSMCIQDTMNTAAVVEEAIALYEAGSQLVRITAPGPKDAENLGQIKAALRQRGYDFPIVADIHFAPRAALIAAEHVEKVRINPGNFVDRKKFAVIEYSNAAYAEELDRVREAFTPLVLRCKELGRAMRIGANHGSLSDRIMNRFGDTPDGMVESALEFIQIARDLDYHQMIVSMKASNPQVMVQAYRLLVARFRSLGFDYPLHLGVTEAGNGQDGRIKSAVGIGALLEDGIGDTIRVSLTEDAIHELPAARRIAARYNEIHGRALPGATSSTLPAATADRRLAESFSKATNPFSYTRFLSEAAAAKNFYVGSKHQHRIIVRLSPAEVSNATLLADLKRRGADALALSTPVGAEVVRSLPLPAILDCGSEWRKALNASEAFAAAACVIDPDAESFDAAELQKLITTLEQRDQLLLLEIQLRSLDETAAAALRRLLHQRHVAQARNLVLSARIEESAPEIVGGVRALRALAAAMHERAADGSAELQPLFIRGHWSDLHSAAYDGAMLAGPLLLDGLGDALWIEADKAAAGQLLRLELDLLQAVRLRLSKTEFISCPSCGRTLFDLQTTTARIQARTGHLKGVKIAIMGCIVNGPGEMADADFGYVGAGPGKIHLYRGKELVKANIPSERADQELVELIREHGLWVEPEEATEQSDES